MKTSIFTRLFAGLTISAITLTAYSMNEPTTVNNKAPFSNSAIQAAGNATAVMYADILNQNLAITYATDNGADITEDMNDWTLRFNGNYPGGEAQAWNDLLAVTGSWNMSEGSNMINISYFSSLSQPVFLSRAWTISSGFKGAAIVLTAADGDQVHLAAGMK